MDARNFVAQQGGRWVVYRDGRQIGSYATQQEAEQAYNAYAGAGTPGAPAPGAGANPLIDSWLRAMGLGEEFRPIITAFYAEKGRLPQSIAEWTTYRNARAGGAAPGAGAPGATGEGGSYQDLIDAILGTNREQWDESKKQAARTLYAGLIQGLTGTAAGLTGPRDWLKYQEYSSGGRGLMEQVFGNARPSFTGPSGTSEARTLQSLLEDLGLVPKAGGGAGTAPTDTDIDAWVKGMGGGATRQQAVDFIAKYGRLPQSIPEWEAFLKGVEPSQQGATPTAAPAQAGAAAQQATTAAAGGLVADNNFPVVPLPPGAGGGVTGPWRGGPLDQPAVGGPPPRNNFPVGPLPPGAGGPLPGFRSWSKDLPPGAGGPGFDPSRGVPLPGGYVTPLPTPGGLPPPADRMPGPITDIPAPPGKGTVGPVAGAPGGVTQPWQVPLPHQFAPGNWEAMNDSAKQLILAMVEKGKAEGGAWDAGDWLKQMYAARPKGTARAGQAQYKWGGRF